MELTKKEELVALSSAMYLMGLEIEASRLKLEKLLEQGLTLSSQEILSEHAVFDRLSGEFSRLEQRFLRLEQEIGVNTP